MGRGSDQPPSEGRGKECFEALQARLWRGNLPQPVAESPRLRAPHILEIHAAVAEQVGRIRREQGKAARFENDADQVGHVGSVDNLVHRARADDDRRRPAPFRLAVRAIKQELPCQVENDLRIAGGQNALAAVLHLRRPRIPQHPYKAVERGLRSVLEVEQRGLVVLIARPRNPAKPRTRSF